MNIHQSTWPNSWPASSQNVQAINIAPGTRFGKLTVIKETNKIGSNRAFLAECDCGTIKPVQGRYLRLGKINSCGCMKHKRTTDGHKRSEHPLYQIWRNMHERTTNRKHKGYATCGGQGVRVCDEWHVFDRFIEDIGPRPKGTMLCRLDFKKDYTPENTRWLTPVQRRAQYIPKIQDAACTV